MYSHRVVLHCNDFMGRGVGGTGRCMSVSPAPNDLDTYEVLVALSALIASLRLLD